MKAFFIATVTEMKSPEKFAEYGQKAGATIAPFGGKLLARGPAKKILTGEDSSIACGVIAFPYMKDLTQWYDSDAYQAIIPLRDEAVTMQITAYEMPN